MEAEGASLLEQMMQAQREAKGQAAAEQEGVPKGKQGFGSGLKKGFLAGAGSEGAKPQPPKKAIPTISANKPAAGAQKAACRGVVLPEVQSAVDEATPPFLKALQSGEWVTPEFQEKLVKNQSLLRKLQDPRYAAFLQEMSRDPKATLEKHKGNTELESFMLEMGQLLGDHFTKLGEGQGQQQQQQQQQQPAPAAQQKVEGPLVEEALRRQQQKAARERLTTREDEEEERAKVDKVLSDPVLRGLLTDPGMQRVLQECGQPGGMARHMRDPETAAKIRRLADAGLVQLG